MINLLINNIFGMKLGIFFRLFFQILHNSAIQAGEKGSMNDENLAIPEVITMFDWTD